MNLRLDDEHVAEGRLAEQLRMLQDMRQEGKLDLIGISNADTATVRRVLDLTDIASVQNAYSIINRAGEDELALCEERGLAFVPFFPLGSAFTGGPKQLAAGPRDRRGRNQTSSQPLSESESHEDGERQAERKSPQCGDDVSPA
jgi:aryl-alcohol dehydrogenase-like predicted oxidoreductase